jgi:hypothetical protein
MELYLRGLVVIETFSFLHLAGEGKYLTEAWGFQLNFSVN